MPPLRIGPRHVGEKRALRPGLRMEKHRHMAGKRRRAVVGDEGREAVALNERGDFAGVLHSESGWNIHNSLYRKSPAASLPRLAIMTWVWAARAWTRPKFRRPPATSEP